MITLLLFGHAATWEVAFTSVRHFDKTCNVLAYIKVDFIQNIRCIAETAWFLARERQPNSTIQEQVRNIFNQRGISTTDLIPTRQTDCPPEPTPAH